MSWNRSDNDVAPKKAKKSSFSPKLTIWFFSLVVAAGALVLGFVLFLGRTNQPACSETKKTKSISVAKHDHSKHSNTKVESTKRKIDFSKHEVPDIPKVSIYKKEISDEEWNNLTNRPFKTSAEQLISIVFSCTPGNSPLPIPSLNEEDRKNILGILLSKNPVKDSDSERVATLKQTVELAKKEMIEYLKEGGDPDDFLRYYHEELRTAYIYRLEADKQTRAIYKEYGPEAAKEFCDKVNEKLSEKEILKLDFDEYEEDYREAWERVNSNQ